MSRRAPCDQTATDWARPLPTGPVLAQRTDPARGDIEAFIARVFRRAYGADIHQFAPWLLALYDGERILGAVGIRPATLEPLFIQQYLDARIEQVVATVERQPVDGETIAEIGNLAVIRPGTGVLLFIALCLLLDSRNFRWVVCNATPGVQNLFARLNWPVTAVARADKTRLQEGYQHWGRYYDQPSQVLATSAATCRAQLAANPALANVSTQLAALLGERPMPSPDHP
ncbi:MAG: thermostable hemolysin [Porticoccaceae bacterium]